MVCFRYRNAVILNGNLDVHFVCDSAVTSNTGLQAVQYAYMYESMSRIGPFVADLIESRGLALIFKKKLGKGATGGFVTLALCDIVAL